MTTQPTVPKFDKNVSPDKTERGGQFLVSDKLKKITFSKKPAPKAPTRGKADKG